MKTIITIMAIGSILLAGMVVANGIMQGIYHAFGSLPDWAWILMTLSVLFFYANRNSAKEREETKKREE